MPVIRVVNIIRIKIGSVNVPKISFIATAAPVLVREIIYNEIKENPITKVFVEPTKTRKPFLFVFEIMFPITAACPLPKPGRKLQKGEAKSEPSKGFFKLILGLVIICKGIGGFDFMLVRIMEEPKSPDNKGRSGWLTEFMFKIINPKNPVRRKTCKAWSLCFSIETKKIEIAINRKGRIAKIYG